eukprot:7636343-Karenia_brevis.AAC.1
MLWPESLEWASWATWLLKELTVGMLWPQNKESGVGILGHMATKGVNSGNGVAKESGAGILGHMATKGVRSENGVARESL